MKSARSVSLFLCTLSLLLAIGLEARAPGSAEIAIPFDFPPGIILTSPVGMDTFYVDPEMTGIPLEILVTDMLGSPVTNDMGDPIDIPVDFLLTKLPDGATGAGFQPEGLDSIRILSDISGIAQVNFDVGDLPGVYRVEAKSPYSDLNWSFTFVTGGFTTHITVIPAVPSAPVDTLGGILVDIFPVDRDLTPILDAELVVTLRQGPDYKKSYPVTNMGGGLYQALVPSAIADLATIIATDTSSCAEGWADVEYLKDIGDSLYFDPSDVQFMAYSIGEDQYYIVGTYLYDRFGNKFFEEETNYTGAVLGDPPIALVDSTWIENDYFMNRVRAIDVGSCELQVDEWNFGVTDVVPLDFYAVALLDPEGTTVVEDSITVPLVIYMTDPMDTLGFYDLEISYNSDALELVDVLDGDPFDGFAAPMVVDVNDSTVSLSQTYSGIGGGETSKMVHIADLTFYAQNPGDMRIDSPIVYAIGTTSGKTVAAAPVKPTKKKVKAKKILNLKIFAEKGSGMTKESVKKDIAHAQAVFDKNYAACCAITIKWDGKIDTFKTSDYDKDNDKKLKDYTDSKLTDEEKALINKTKSRRSSSSANVYYMKNNCTPTGKSHTIGEAITSDNFGSGNASVVSGSSLRTYGSREKKNGDTMNKGLAHELAHLLGELADLAGPGSANLMEYNSTGKNDSGVKLTKEQCKKIMDKGTSKGLLKDS